VQLCEAFLAAFEFAPILTIGGLEKSSMDLVLLAALVTALCVTLWAAVAIQCSGVRWLRIVDFVVSMGAAVAAYITTFQYEYFANANTRVCGWPVPYIVFQRDNADAPWLDFIGWTLAAAYPLNLLFYLFLPSVVMLVMHYWLRRRRGA
jgi:hypothetical protein